MTDLVAEARAVLDAAERNEPLSGTRLLSWTRTNARALLDRYEALQRERDGALVCYEEVCGFQRNAERALRTALAERDALQRKLDDLLGNKT